MGYTEYFPQRRSFTDSEWDSIIGKVNQVFDWAKTNGIKIDDQDDGEPIADNKQIWFNGIGDESHETFVLCKYNTNNYNFCKTAEKPYTVVVQLVLMICNDVAPNALGISTDGKWDNEWIGAREAYKELFGVEPEKMF